MVEVILCLCIIFEKYIFLSGSYLGIQEPGRADGDNGGGDTLTRAHITALFFTFPSDISVKCL